MDKNYQNTLELNVTPGEENPTWGDLGAVFTNIATSINEILHQVSYLSSQGWGSTEVVGGQFTMALTGEKTTGDAVSDYITNTNVSLAFGSSRKTQVKLTTLTHAITWNVTMANITETGGDSQGVVGLSLVLHSNGAPSVSVLADNGARLASLASAGLVLSPQFLPSQYGYQSFTTDATDTVTAVAKDTNAVIVMTNNGTVVTNGSPITWDSGANALVIKVTNGGVTKVYSVFVTKS